MRISKLIQMLEDAKTDHGDIKIFLEDGTEITEVGGILYEPQEDGTVKAVLV